VTVYIFSFGSYIQASNAQIATAEPRREVDVMKIFLFAVA